MGLSACAVAWRTVIAMTVGRRLRLVAFLLPVSAAGLAGCGSAVSPVPSTPGSALPATTLPSTSVVARADGPPIPHEDRAPLQEVPPDPTGSALPPSPAVLEQLEQARRKYLIPEEVSVAAESVHAGALAFAAALAYGIENPQPSSLRLTLPGHPAPVALPASINALARAAMFARPALQMADVGPSRPDTQGAVWVAVFGGASGPVGSVVSSCSAVRLRSDGVSVVIDVVAVESTVTRQPLDRSDYVGLRCVLDLDMSSMERFVPQT